MPRSTQTKPMNTRYSALLASCRIAAMLFLVFLFCPFSTKAQENNAKAFPNLIFNDEDGVMHNILGVKSKLTLVHFWATWCGPCVRELPRIDALQRDYGDQGLKVLAISLDGEGKTKKVADFYAAHGITNLKVYVDTGTAMQTIALGALPTTFFLDKDGLVVDAVEGALNWDNPRARTEIEKYLK